MMTSSAFNNFFKSLLFIVVGCVVQNNSAAQDFTRLINDPVVNEGRYSEGTSWGDINNDGYLDVFIPHLHTDLENTLFINNGDGSFSEMTTGPVVADAGRSTGGSFGDFDNDGHLDLFVSNYYGLNNFLYLNDGAGTFTKVTEGPVVSDGGSSFGSSVADYDNDGFLDIYVTNGADTATGEDNFLYKNNGDGTFTRILVGAMVNDGQPSSASSWSDYDQDGDQDLFVANGFTRDVAQINNAFYQNNGDGSFTEIDPVTIGIEHSYSSNGSWADYDNDGDFDLLITNFLGNDNNLYRNNGDGTFTKITDGMLSNDGGDSVSSTWGDYDNDGDLDVYVTNDFNENNTLYDNNGDGTFTKVSEGEPSNGGGRSNGATWADYNNDGYLDLFVPNGQRPVVQSNVMFTNNGTSGNNWVNIKCTGVASNAAGIGAEVRAKATINSASIWQLRQVSGSTGFNAQNSFNVEFGLGDATQVDSLIIEWPSGQVDVYTDVAAGVFYEAVESMGIDPTRTSIQEDAGIIEGVELLGNYPNPFGATTTISYELPRSGHIRIRVYNALGQRLTTLLDAFKEAGNHEVMFGTMGLSPGVFYYRIEYAKRFEVRKMVKVR